MQSEPLTRATILSLTGPALDEAITEHVAPWPLWDGAGIAPPRPFLMRGATGLMFLPEAGWMDWHPHRSLDAVRLLELALTEGRQSIYHLELGRVLEAAGIIRFSGCLTDAERFALVTASPTIRCHALLLAVVAPE